MLHALGEMDVDVVSHLYHLFIRQRLICAGKVVDLWAEQFAEYRLEELEQQIFEDHLWDLLVEDEDETLLLLRCERPEF